MVHVHCVRDDQNELRIVLSHAAQKMSNIFTSMVGFLARLFISSPTNNDQD